MRITGIGRIVLVLLLFLGFAARSQFQYRFENISTDQGLSNGSVSAILQDRKGFMYFGTNQGLNRYDGYTFNVFFSQSDNPYGLSNNNVRCLFESKSGEIWIGTDGGEDRSGTLWIGHGTIGISKVKNNKGFIELSTSSDVSKGLAGNNVIAMHSDRHGTLWAAIIDRGIQKIEFLKKPSSTK